MDLFILVTRQQPASQHNGVMNQMIINPFVKVHIYLGIFYYECYCFSQMGGGGELTPRGEGLQALTLSIWPIICQFSPKTASKNKEFWAVPCTPLFHQWHKTFLNCFFVSASCPDISLQNGVAVYGGYAFEGRYLEHTRAWMVCDGGFTRSGPKFRTCQSSRTWSGQEATCITSK